MLFRIILLFLPVICFADYLPEDQQSSGGDIHVIWLPENIELYSNVGSQKLMFSVNFRDGHVSTVDWRRGNLVKNSPNVQLIIDALKKWRCNQLKVDGKIIREWGDYYEIILKFDISSNKGNFIVRRNMSVIFEGMLSKTTNRKLNAVELKEFKMQVTNKGY
ncbi:MAG: hypothetical protein ACSHX0_09925 [Akkermansiaceae bacterium]